MIVIALLSLAIGYLLLVAFVYARQGKMLYYPEKEFYALPDRVGLPYEDVSLRTSDGITLHAWHIPAQQSAGTVLFCHGNAGNISHRLDSIRIFHDLGLGVLIFDYRGYGRSEGTPSEEGTYRDAEAAWDFLVSSGRERPERIVLFGRSLGSAVAAELALRKKAGALIIESGFTSVPDLGARFFPHLPVRLISRYRYDTLGKIGKIAIPKLFIHSPRDEMIPFEQGMKLFEAAAEPKAFLRIDGTHNEGFLFSGALYQEGIRSFLLRSLPGMVQNEINQQKSGGGR